MLKLCAAFIALLAVAASLHAQIRIDGHWWNGANPESRRGTLNGTIDCMVSNHSAKLPTLTVPAFQEQVDVAFAQDTAGRTLAEVLLALPKKSPPRAPGGEDYSKEKHGWFDGDYWGSAKDDERSGFLIGYLSCGNTLPVSISRINEYRDTIDLWYDKHPSSNAKIANVIAKIRQQAKGEKNPSVPSPPQKPK
jgi:hypothetical protein